MCQLAGCNDDDVVALLDEGRRHGSARGLAHTLTPFQTEQGLQADPNMPRPGITLWAGGGAEIFPRTTIGGTRIPWGRLTSSERRIKRARIKLNQGQLETPGVLVLTVDNMTRALKVGVQHCTECGQPMHDRGDGVERCLKGCASPLVA